MNNPEQVTYFGETDARNKHVRFGIKAKDRTRHVYVIGKTGMGKSTVLENMAVQDIQNGNGFAFMDPHGKTAELLLEYIPEERKKDVLYFAPFDSEFPVGFNIMENVGFNKRHLVVSGIMSTFKKIWVDAWSARMEYILTNTLLALLEYPDSTLLSVNKMLSDKAFRNEVVSHVTDAAVRAFWVDEFGSWTDKYIAESVPAIQNKIGQFTGNPIIRNIIGQPKSSFDLRDMMDENKIIIVNLSKGQIGEVNANLLGSMLITKIYLSAMSRADQSEEELDKLPNFYLYVDEFQSFANDSFADILSEARKYKLNLTIAHQYIEQMEDVVRAAVFGNVGTMITFRVGAYDADVLEKEFAPVFLAEDIVNLGKYQIYLKLMIDGIGSKPFSSATMAPIPKPAINLRNEVVASSQQQFARPRAMVEEVANKFLASTENNKSNNNSSNSNSSNDRSSGDRQRKDSFAKSSPSSNRANESRPERSERPMERNVERTNERSDERRESNRPPQARRPEGARPEHARPKDDGGVAQPFKKVFSHEAFKNDIIKNAQEQLKKERSESTIEEVRLTALKGANPKVQSEENKNALRDALRSVLGELPSEANAPSEVKMTAHKPAETKREMPQVSQEQSKPNIQQPEIPKKEGTKGISDDVLRDLLKVTSDDL